MRDSHLAPGRLLDRQLDHRLLYFRPHPILDIWPLPRKLAQSLLATGLVELLETVKAIARIAHHAAGRRHVSKLLREFQQSHLRSDNLVTPGHRRLLQDTQSKSTMCQI
jgi:hypothetical protein